MTSTKQVLCNKVRYVQVLRLRILRKKVPSNEAEMKEKVQRANVTASSFLLGVGIKVVIVD